MNNLRFLGLVPEIARYLAFKAKWQAYADFGDVLQPSLAESLAHEDADILAAIRRQLEVLRVNDPEDAAAMESEMRARWIPLVEIEGFAVVTGHEDLAHSP